MYFESEPTNDELAYDGDELESSDDATQQPANEPGQNADESESISPENAQAAPPTNFSVAHTEVAESITEPKPRIPRAGTAFLTFATFFLAQVVVSIFVGIAAGIIAVAALGLKPDESGFLAFVTQTILYSLLPISILSGYSVLMVTRWLARDVITDGEVTGVGWVKSSPMKCLAGAALGAVIYCSTIFLVSSLFPNLKPESGGPIEAMAKQGGVMLLLLIIAVVIFAPLVEEFLFRGVMLAGFTRSFGFPVAAFFCTSLFVLVHLEAIMRYTPAVIPLTGLALGAIWVRVKFKSVWPAIAAHFGYNGMAVLLPLILKLISAGE